MNIRLADNKMHKKEVCKSYNIIPSSEMLLIKIISDIINDNSEYVET